MKRNIAEERQDRVKALTRFAEENKIPVKNMILLNTALTHTSYVNEHKNQVHHDNERLEFLGDAVLDLVVGEYLFMRFPSWPEGDLTRHMRLGKGEEKSGGRTRETILGDAFEAVIGAIYLDNDYEVVSRFILGHMKKFLDIVDEGTYDHDYKSDLQELVQKDGCSHVEYKVARSEGPDHDKTIWMDVYINGKCMGHGTGKNKKSAAQKAAKEAMATLQHK